MKDSLPTSVFRTRLTLDIGDGSLLADEIHRMSMDLFPVDLLEDSPRREVGVLSRREGGDLLVQSLIPPTRPVRGATIIETGTWDLPTGVSQVTVKVALAAEGNTSSGPTFLPKEARRRSERRPIAPGRRREWAIKKLSGAGLLFQTPPDVSTGELRFATPSRPPIPVVEVRGTALVVDADALRDALVNGVGRGRSYGLGLVDVQLT